MTDKSIITSTESNPNPCANWIRHHPIGYKSKINIQDDENEVAPMLLGREEFIDNKVIEVVTPIVNEDDDEVVEPLMLGREQPINKRTRTK